MNVTFYRLEMRRLLRNYVNLFFVVGLPVFFYLIFGASPSYADEPVRDGNVAMWIMIAMAAYGAVSATNGIGGSTALERMQGWTRQLGLTPLPDREYVKVKTATAATMGGFTILLVFLAGAVTGAKAPLSVWFASGLILLAGSVTFALYGLNFGLAIRSESSLGASAGSLVLLSFLGNIFIPLEGWKLTLAKFTPLYGYVSMARRPLTGGGNLEPSSGELLYEPLWQPMTNLVVWTTVFFLLAVSLVHRGRDRQ